MVLDGNAVRSVDRAAALLQHDELRKAYLGR